MMSDILDIGEGEEVFNPEDLDEKEVLGDDEDGGSKMFVSLFKSIKWFGYFRKKEDDNDDLYDAAIEPSGMVNENVKRESSTDTPVSLAKIPVQSSVTATGSSSSVSASGKRYCCYIGNMTWWTTDADLQVNKRFVFKHLFYIPEFNTKLRNRRFGGYQILREQK